MQYKIGNLAYTGWLTDVVYLDAPFRGTPGMTYTFQVRIRDKAGNQSSWVQSSVVAVSKVTKYYTFGASRVAMRQGSVVYYLHGDHLGSTSLTTDQSGAVVSQGRYLPYGETRWGGNGPTDFGFTSQRHEMGFGLYDYNARYYSPYLNRFVSPDPIIPDPKDPQNFNRYSYVLNNPVRYTDPTGHCIYYTCEQAIYGAVNAYASVVSNETTAQTAEMVHQMNADVSTVFSNAPLEDRFMPAVRVGGGATLVASTVASGLALAGTQAVGAVSTSSAFALLGSATAATGNLAGQAINKAGTGQSIDYGEVTIAGGVGFAAGSLAPFGATTLGGAAALGGLSSVGQYELVQLNSGNQITPQGILLNAAVGSAAGALAGSVPARTGNSPVSLSPFANNSALRNVAIMDMYSGQAANALARSGLARGITGATGSNLDWPKAQEENCKRFGCP